MDYKAWVRRRKEEKKISWDAIAAAVEKSDKRISCSSSALTQFAVGKKGETLRPSYTAFMPAINKLLGAAPPTLCDPEDPLSQLKDRIDSMWRSFDSGERERFLTAMESILKLADR